MSDEIIDCRSCKKKNGCSFFSPDGMPHALCERLFAAQIIKWSAAYKIGYEKIKTFSERDRYTWKMELKNFLIDSRQ